MKFNNVKDLPLFQSVSNEKLTLLFSPPPALHIMLGIFNQLWKLIEYTSEKNKKLFHEFAILHSCTKETYFGKTFEGNECAKLLTKISSEKSEIN